MLNYAVVERYVFSDTNMSNIVRFHGQSNRSVETPKVKYNQPVTSCVICAEDIINFAISNCTPSHPVCSKCMTRLRFLQKDNRCPVCRSELKWVLFASKLIVWDQTPFAEETDKKRVVSFFFDLFLV